MFLVLFSLFWDNLQALPMVHAQVTRLELFRGEERLEKKNVMEMKILFVLVLSIITHPIT